MEMRGTHRTAIYICFCFRRAAPGVRTLVSQAQDQPSAPGHARISATSRTAHLPRAPCGSPGGRATATGLWRWLCERAPQVEEHRMRGSPPCRRTRGYAPAQSGSATEARTRLPCAHRWGEATRCCLATSSRSVTFLEAARKQELTVDASRAFALLCTSSQRRADDAQVLEAVDQSAGHCMMARRTLARRRGRDGGGKRRRVPSHLCSLVYFSIHV